jgi:hypothetical protein
MQNQVLLIELKKFKKKLNQKRLIIFLHLRLQ